jgi:hypothetical protein
VCASSSRIGERIAVTVRAWSAASLAALALGVPVADSSGVALGAVHADEANAPFCHGSFKRVRPRHVGFSFSCENEDVTGFELQANRTLSFVYDPVLAFECQRKTGRSFVCEDIHSGAGPVGSGIATVSEPLCHRGAHLMLRITPFLNFENRPRPSVTLKGPC